MEKNLKILTNLWGENINSGFNLLWNLHYNKQIDIDAIYSTKMEHYTLSDFLIEQRRDLKKSYLDKHFLIYVLFMDNKPFLLDIKHKSNNYNLNLNQTTIAHKVGGNSLSIINYLYGGNKINKSKSWTYASDVYLLPKSILSEEYSAIPLIEKRIKQQEGCYFFHNKFQNKKQKTWWYDHLRYEFLKEINHNKRLNKIKEMVPRKEMIETYKRISNNLSNEIFDEISELGKSINKDVINTKIQKLITLNQKISVFISDNDVNLVKNYLMVKNIGEKHDGNK